MSNRFKIAIVGRPNVGKSALFNRICGKRISIVHEMEGVTRDRLYADVDFFGKQIQLIDTGGIDPSLNLPFNEEVRRQAEIAIEEADSLIFVVNARDGISPLDFDLAKTLLRRGKQVCLAVNKVDSDSQDDLVYPFYNLGIKDTLGISALHGYNVAEIVEVALKGYFEPKEEESARIKVAIVGRPNVGKSTMINALLNDERCVVSPIAGTTRDSIDIPFSYDGTDYTLIDTAGIRKMRAHKEAVDKFAAIRTERAIDRATVCLLVIDSLEGLTVQEKRIAAHIEKSGKPCVILFNKWDMMKDIRQEHVVKDIADFVPFLSYCPMLFVSAKTGRNLDKILKKAVEVHQNAGFRITTGELNRFVERVVQLRHPPMIQGKRLRIYYMSQIGVNPPLFVLFVNFPELMMDHYKKFMINQFRKEYTFEGVPISFKLKPRKSDRNESKIEMRSSKPKLLEESIDEDFAGDDVLPDNFDDALTDQIEI